MQGGYKDQNQWINKIYHNAINPKEHILEAYIAIDHKVDNYDNAWEWEDYSMANYV